jgi:hypothetical protein
MCFEGTGRGRLLLLKRRQASLVQEDPVHHLLSRWKTICSNACSGHLGRGEEQPRRSDPAPRHVFGEFRRDKSERTHGVNVVRRGRDRGRTTSSAGMPIIHLFKATFPSGWFDCCGRGNPRDSNQTSVVGTCISPRQTLIGVYESTRSTWHQQILESYNGRAV